MTRITSKMCDGRFLTAQAEKQGLRVKNGQGDHAIICAPVGRGYMVCPQRKLGKGLACEIVKWLVKAGIVFAFLLGLILNAR